MFPQRTLIDAELKKLNEWADNGQFDPPRFSVCKEAGVHGSYCQVPQAYISGVQLQPGM